MKKIIKFVFSFAFLALAVVWILFAVELLYPEEVQIFANWEWFQNDLLPKIQQSYIGHPQGREGFELVVYSGSIFLIYTSTIFLISKIPVIGGFVKALTSFVGFIALALVVIGSLLWSGVFPL
ncbi:MAG: hypothetical protein ACRC8C_02730 [Mycoplasmoidaceae bacterium]